MRMTLIVLLACVLTPTASALDKKDEERAVAEIKKLGGVVTVDPKSNRVVEVDFASPGVTDDGLKHLKALKDLKGLDLGRSQVTNGGLQYLGKELKALQELYLSSPRVTDEGVMHLREMRTLSRLTLKATKVSDEGVKALQQSLPKLEIIRSTVAP